MLIDYIQEIASSFAITTKQLYTIFQIVFGSFICRNNTHTKMLE